MIDFKKYFNYCMSGISAHFYDVICNVVVLDASSCLLSQYVASK
jgi:hypothetical protein